ncbi:hypothetical protein FVEN_g9181 [Fusarium venenatum]|uniref:BTB domain-containing protein n=1 Tax=Fusarium venenatum TaxID=56646 RepID=A0A2L2TUI2_9HYPO|nr:uncharacterized protein FVRRES_00397 [Fusarium venenatum]KAG8352904.1 hypothetical protein FVEN_g9181 [Fusarium venenatum]KAH7006355.1 hypothetical protein EDB82DRAFT_552807 [Fusarium venenatum]CEI63885.1 unnamed protein product [Fusarium venenatum]
MAIITYEIDSGGDIELVLEYLNKQKIVPIITSGGWDDYHVPRYDGNCVLQNPTLVERYAVFNIQQDAEDKTTEVRMRVSSRHLILASCTFRTMLEGPWCENLLQASHSQSGPVQIKTTDWDAAALAIVMDAIHGRYQDILKDIHPGLLARIATVIDYYACHENLQPISDIWMTGVRGTYPVPDVYCKSSLVWLYISWVFSKLDIMLPISRMLLRRISGLSFINSEDLPIGHILEKIDIKRQQCIGRFMSGLNALRKQLSDEEGCPVAKNPYCSATMLGILIREQQKLRLLDPPPAAPYSGYNLAFFISASNAFPSSRPDRGKDRQGLYKYKSCTCIITWRLTYVGLEIGKDINGYDLTVLQ